MPDSTPKPAAAFREFMLNKLVRVFLKSANNDPVAAREAAARTLDAFNCQSEDEQLLAATVITFSHSALDTFSLAAAPGVPPQQAKQIQACATSLCREATRAKNRLLQKQQERRLRVEPPKPPEVPKPPRITWTGAYMDTRRELRLPAYRKAMAQSQ